MTYQIPHRVVTRTPFVRNMIGLVMGYDTRRPADERTDMSRAVRHTVAA